MSESVRRPGCAALAVVARGDAVLLVRRANPPDAGLWGFPGGRIEWGETAGAAAVRELHEETGIVAAAGPVLQVVEAFDRASDGGVRHHYVMVAVRCAWVSGEGVPGDDALETAWVKVTDLVARRGDLSECVEDVARAALADRL